VRTHLFQPAIDGKTYTFRLGGTAPSRQRFKELFRRLRRCRMQGTDIDDETARWLGDMGDDMHARIAETGLVEPRQPLTGAPRLSNWLDRYTDERRPELSASSVKKLMAVAKSLKAAFPDDPRIDEITVDQAAGGRATLVARGLSDASVRLAIRYAKLVFGAAAKRDMLPRHPFAGRPSASRARGDMGRYVTPEETVKLLEVAPTGQWRALIGLARLAGLRCPSETHSVTWSDVDWDRWRLRVFAPKTKTTRYVPIVPELQSILTDAYAAAAEGSVKIVPLSCNNLRRQLLAIIAKAGLEPWSDLYQALRRSCETQWSTEHPQAAVSRWLGHSMQVSERHYLSVADAVFDRATGRTQGALSFALSGSAKSRHNPSQTVDGAAGVSDPENAEIPAYSAENFNGSGRIRTCDRAIMSRLL